MTGFARAEGAEPPVSWHWEVRSVNGRGLDMRVRLPAGYERLELKVREAVARRVKRGNLQVALNVTATDGAAEIRLNERALADVIKAAERVRALTGAPAPTVEGLLAIRGVLELADAGESEEAFDARCARILATFEEALTGLDAARSAEGERLAAVIGAHIDEIERLIAAVAASPARTPEAIRRRIADALARLGDEAQAFDSARLHQEAVLIATRADVEEELKRLSAHVAAARDLLSEGQGAGRKLDFLTQEFNREANTLCSKSNDIEITRLGLALKSVIDQMREQVQNIE